MYPDYRRAHGFAILLTTEWGEGGNLDPNLVVGKKYPIKFSGMHKGKCIVNVPGNNSSSGEIGNQWEITSAWDTDLEKWVGQ